MNKTFYSVRHLVAALTVTVVAAVACADTDTPSGLGTQQLSISGDTVVGNGQLAELQQRRAAWIARDIKDYRVQLQIVCFCAGDIRRPVLIEVRDNVIAKVWDLETARPVTTVSSYPTITGLFDRAIAELSKAGGHVSVAYDGTFGFPVRIEIGTLANDAGTMYQLGGFRPL